MNLLPLSLIGICITLAYAEPMVERTRLMMGTFATITLPQSSASWAERGFERMKAVENALSSYDETAEISRLNLERNVSISADTYEALRLCRRYFKQSGGYFDITVGSLTRGLFHFGESERIPDEAELDAAVVGFGGVHFTPERAWLDPGIRVDLGGMGKGFGVDRAAELFSANGISTGIIALSGDIRCLDRCRLSVQDPFSEEGTLMTFTTRREGMSVSTSGNYRRYIRDKEHNHLIDPTGKRPQRCFASITLIAELSNADLDAYATAASVMPKEKALAFLKGIDTAYVVVENDGTRHVSANLERFISDAVFNDAAPAAEAEQPQEP